MTAWPAALRIRRLLVPVGLVLATVLAGCAQLAPAAPDALLHDNVFAHPPRPADADAVLAPSPAMLAYVQALRSQVSRAADLPMALGTSLYQPGGLQLDYDTSITRNAAQAFAERSGNCLSLVLMTAALAGALGLEVGFQEVPVGDLYRREGDLTLHTGHVNLVLGPRLPQQAWRTASADVVKRQWVIDFLPRETAVGLPAQPITQQRVLAMFMNNRAVESLLAQQPATAYAWLREALRADPGFAAAYNTLGVVYQRAGQLVLAAASYARGLALDDQSVAAMGNLAQVLRAQGRVAEARAWDQRRLALEPLPPLQALTLGQAALAAQDWASAGQYFRLALRRQPDLHEAWFGLARVHLAQGDTTQAEQALREAQAVSVTHGERARYAGKLAALRAAAAQ